MHNTALYTIEPGLLCSEGHSLFLVFKLIRQQSEGCKQLTRTFTTEGMSIAVGENMISE